MITNKLPSGLWPVMLTPFHENNRIDVEGLRRLTNLYINAGAHGLFSNCLSSEMFQLTDEERLQIVRTVVTESRSRVPVVAAGTFSSDMNRCASFIKQVYDTGVAAVIVVTNQIADTGENDDVFKKRIDLLLQQTGDIPLGLYECPDPYKRLLSPAMMKWLGETGRFFYHKDTSCDLEAIKAKVKAIEGTQLSFYNADTPTALASIENGASGISPIGANFYPELYTFLISQFNSNRKSEALAHLNAQLDVMDTLVHRYYPFSAKLFLRQRGLPIAPVCRIPVRKMRPVDNMKLQDLMRVFTHTAEYFRINTGTIG